MPVELYVIMHVSSLIVMQGHYPDTSSCEQFPPAVLSVNFTESACNSPTHWSIMVGSFSPVVSSNNLLALDRTIRTSSGGTTTSAAHPRDNGKPGAGPPRGSTVCMGTFKMSSDEDEVQYILHNLVFGLALELNFSIKVSITSAWYAEHSSCFGSVP